jgi:membrane fusion protein (multidrug efflux system)
MPNGNSVERASEPVHPSATSGAAPEAEPSAPRSQPGAPATKRPLWMWIAGGVLIVLLLYVAVPRVVTAFKTVSTDDAYVNGHVTFVAPRVPGYVVRVLVDDNNRVHKGDLLVELDKEPYQVKVDIAQAAVGVAQADLVAAQAKDQSLAGLAHSERYI